MPDTIIVLDFDSTIVAAEGLDEIAKLSLADDADRERKILAIEGITRDGMEGRIGIDESLSRRLDQLHITRAHVAAVVKLLKARLAPSFRRNKAAIKKNASRIYVVSSGFRDYVVPVCAELGIAPDHIVANDLVWNKDGVVINYDRKSPLAKPRGKADAVRALKLKGRIVAVGDGATDCEIRDHGAAHEFVAYCENIERENVVARADRVVRSVDELLWIYDLPGAPSYPKSRMVALLLENIHADAAERLREEGYKVETLSDALPHEELTRALRGVSLLGIRSKTQVSAATLAAADRLLAIGCFCIGTEQVDLAAASARGVVARRRVAQERAGMPRNARENPRNHRLRPHRFAALGVGRSDGNAGALSRLGASDAAGQRAQGEESERSSEQERCRQRACRWSSREHPSH